jgi:hypothetical protein
MVEVDDRLDRVTYRRATDQKSRFTAGHMLRKLEVAVSDVGPERRFVFRIEGQAKDGEIDPPNSIRDWTNISARETITRTEARQLAIWLFARTCSAPIRRLLRPFGFGGRPGT